MSASGPQRFRRAASWIVPSVALAAIPKCPVCLAAYVTVFTGCGISLAVAGAVRLIMAASCIACLAYLAAKSLSATIAGR
ncbi:MAG TPA: hypothetical protein VGM76_00760 [Lacipirellulaceae bacterium]